MSRKLQNNRAIWTDAMVYAITVELQDAKKVLDYLQSNDLLDRSYQFKKTKDSISFPSTKKFPLSDIKTLLPSATIKRVTKDFFTQTTRPSTLKDALAKTLTVKQLARLKTAYDLVGNIAILEIDDQLREHEKKIAQALIESNPAIKTVLRKDSAHEGEFRTQRMKFLAGKDTRQTLHSESGVRMYVDVEKVYFSPRLSTERLRIAEQVKPGENIMVFFSGAAPQPLILAKKTEAGCIVGIEINPVGHELGIESVKLNKCKNVHLFCGDVHKVLPTLLQPQKIIPPLPKTYDRIIMNLPKSAHEFLSDALMIATRGTIIHYYDFLHEDEFDTAIKRIDDACRLKSRQYKVHGIHTCGAQGVRIYRICVDVEIL